MAAAGQSVRASPSACASDGGDGAGAAEGAPANRQASTAPARPSLVIPSAPRLLTVLHDFEARSPDELTLHKGETVELLEGDEEFGDGWYTGRSLTTHAHGLFPQVYTAPTPAAQPDMRPPPPPAIFASQAPLPAPPPSRPSSASTPPVPPDGAPLAADSRSPPAVSPPSSPDSHVSVSSSQALADESHPSPEPLVVEKAASATSGRSTPTAAIGRGSEGQRSMLLVGNTVEERAANYVQGLHSPVVEDTLSDIEEAISEIHKNRESRANILAYGPRHSAEMPSAGAASARERLASTSVLHDSSSEYSVHVDQVSHDAGSDVEEGEEALPIQGYHEADDVPYTKADVQAWTPAEVSQYLQSRQIAHGTCVKFEEQEVSGAILLQLEMAHLKELEIGSFGKRFEVWKEIEHLIRNLKPPRTKPRSGSATRLSAVSFVPETGQRPRSSTVGAVLPRIPSQHNNRPASRQQQQRINVSEANLYQPVPEQPQTATTIASSMASPTFEVFEAPRSPPLSPQRADSRRYTAQSRKRTSMHDSSPATALNTALATGAAILSAGGIGGSDRKTHHRDGSFDRNWSLAASGGVPPRPATASGVRDMNGSRQHKASASTGTGDSSLTTDSGFSGSQPQTPRITERSYFSSGESAPRERKVLQKKNARHSRVASAESHSPAPPTRKITPTLSLSAAHAYYKAGKEKHKRKSASFSGATPDLSADPDPPKLAPSPSTKGTGAQQRIADDSFIGRAISPASAPFPAPRSISETLATKPPSIETPTSAGARSVGSAEESTASLTATVDSESLSPGRGPKKSERTQSFSAKRIRSVASGSALRQKSKKQTTAWEKGLRIITPAEAALEGDYSGWMKKRGSSGVSTWKSRFFVLTGRRLSYFYSESDTKERGLIDITSHKVLPAADDKLIGLHAAFAAATSPAVSPKPSHSPHFQSMDSTDPSSPEKDKQANPEDAEDPEDAKEKEKTEKDNGKEKEKEKEKGKYKDKEKDKDKEKKKDWYDKSWFTFKLVPPGPGAAKGVTFTPPRLHYFATDTREEGKRWMAAIMKATIDRDETKPVVTSYSAKTISLSKARMLKARPPELGRTGNGNANGLAIMGLPEAGEEGDADVEDEGRLEERLLPAYQPKMSEASGNSNSETTVEETDSDGALKADGQLALQVAAFGIVS